MAGKPKKAGWGGPRKGAGAKPKYMLSDSQVAKMLRTAKKWEKEKGKSIDDIILEIIYGDIDQKVSIRDRLAAVECFKKYTLPKTSKSEQDVTVTHNNGPVIGLPEMKPDPSKLKVVK